MLFEGNILLKVSVEASSARVAQVRLKQEFEISHYGVKKEILLAPEFKEELVVKEPETAEDKGEKEE